MASLVPAFARPRLAGAPGEPLAMLSLPYSAVTLAPSLLGR